MNNVSDPLDWPLSDHLQPRYANAFKRSGRHTARDLIRDISDHGVQYSFRKDAKVYRPGIGDGCIAAALALLRSLGFDWRKHLRKKSIIETAINNEIKSVQRLYAMLEFYLMTRGSNMLKKEEIQLILRLIEEKYGFGYADDKEVAKLQAKLSIILEATSR